MGWPERYCIKIRQHVPGRRNFQKLVMNVADSAGVESNEEPVLRPWIAPPPTVWPPPLCLPATKCQYPLWTGRTPRPPLFCGAPAVKFSLCAEHVARCYHPFNRAA
jgi:hypothetical protein